MGKRQLAGAPDQERAHRRSGVISRAAMMIVFVVIAAGCSGSGGDSSAEDGQTDGESSGNSISSQDESLASAETVEDGDPTEDSGDGSANQLTPEQIADIWLRSDDGVFEPDSGSSTYSTILAPANGSETWTISGSVLDHSTSLRSAAIWEFDEFRWNAWKRTDITPQSADLDESARTIVHFGDRRLAGGTRGSGPNQRGAIWISAADGEWEPVMDSALNRDDGDTDTNDTDTNDTETGAAETVFSIEVSPAGDLAVAAGRYSTTDGSTRTVFWTSTDGRTWTKVGPNKVEQDDLGRPTSLSVGDKGIVAVGSTEGEDLQTYGRAWTSSDGQTWTMVEPQAFADGYDINVNSVAWLDGVYVAVGALRQSADDPRVPVSWTSTDGQTWSGPHSSFGLNDDGRASTTGFGVGSVWASNGRLLANATSGFMQHVWSSTDGRSWDPVGNIWDVRSGGVGINGIATADGAVAVVSDEPSVFFHEATWIEVRADKKETPQPENVAFTNDIAWTPEGFVAVGGYQATPGELQHEFEAGSWISADGETWEEFASLSISEWGSFGSVSIVDGQAYGTLTERVEHAVAEDRRGVGVALRAVDNEWRMFYELGDSDRRSGISNLVQAGDEVIVGGWQFASDLTRTNARLGTVDIDDIGAPQNTPLDMKAPSMWSGEGHQISVLCANDDGSALAVGDGRLESTGHSLLAATRSPDGVWAEQSASDDSLTSADSQFAEVCVGGADRATMAGWVYDVGDYNAAIWIQGDDGSWTRPEIDGLGGDGDQWFSDGTRIGDRTILIGYDWQTGSGVVSLWIGDGAEWSTLPIGPEPWAIESVEIGSDFVGRSQGDEANTKVVIAGRERGRAVMYHTTLAEIDAAVAALSELG